MVKKFSMGFIILILITGLLCGCGKSNQLNMESINWELTTVQENDNGSIIAYNSSIENGDKLYEHAHPVEMSIEVKNKAITLVDNTNSKTYSGTYDVKEKSSKEIIYDIVLDKKSGLAVSGITTTQDGTQIPTLIINIDKYTLNFQEKK